MALHFCLPTAELDTSTLNAPTHLLRSSDPLANHLFWSAQ
jgi:hypothetical protein